MTGTDIRELDATTVERVPSDKTHKYGIVDSEEVAGERLSALHGIVEKPQPQDAPSNLSVVGRYLLTPRIFDHLAATKPGAGGEIQLTDAIAKLLDDEQVLAWEFEGTRFDCGSKLGYLEATVEYALAHPELREDFAAYLKGLDVDRG
jgi:UTP--glucose-1-phosphate uridylyltransferase